MLAIISLAFIRERNWRKLGHTTVVLQSGRLLRLLRELFKKPDSQVHHQTTESETEMGSRHLHLKTMLQATVFILLESSP